MFHLIAVAVVLIGFLVFSIPVIRSQKKLAQTDPEKQQEQSLKIVQNVLGLIFRLTGSELTVLGRENIPDDQPVLYVGNHTSYFDIVAAYPQVKGPTGFVAKKEMESYLTLADWMRLVNCLFLDRKDIKAGLKTILEAVGYVKQGISIWIFPEGTRNESKDNTELMVFHEGSMKIADKSGCPVIPVAITGTRDIFENHIPWIRPSKVTI
jgi:1-acyl-sn-glycerol-3-phosphate acyltransferase